MLQFGMKSPPETSLQSSLYNFLVPSAVVKMHSISIIVLIASVFRLSFAIFPNNTNLFDDYPPLCSELNTSMFSIIDEFKSGAHLKSSPRVKRSTRDYTFSFNLTEFDVINLNFTLFLEPGHNISTALINGTLFRILPINYYITAYQFVNRSSGFKEEFVLIEGTRCKVQFDEQIEAYGNVVCWEKASFCRGSEMDCIDNDDVNHLCYDVKTNRGKNRRDSGDYYLVELGEKIYWRSHLKHFIFEDGTYLTANATLNKWSCTEYGTLVLCDLIYYGEGGGSVQLLETLAG